MINALIMEQPTDTINILLEISIRADIEQVWSSMIQDINLWWGKDFYTSPKTKEFVLEAKVGGRMFEDYGNDEGLPWANVIVLDSPNTIEFKGHLSPQFGGPAMSFLKLSLSQKGTMTTLTLSDTVFGSVSDKTKIDLESGWELLYKEGFKKYVEAKHG